MRPATTAKAERYLNTGRVTIVRRSDDRVEAIVDGDTGRWAVTVSGDPDDLLATWSCTCPAWQHKVGCSHVRAVRLVDAGGSAVTSRAKRDRERRSGGMSVRGRWWRHAARLVGLPPSPR